MKPDTTPDPTTLRGWLELMDAPGCQHDTVGGVRIMDIIKRIQQQTWDQCMESVQRAIDEQI